MDNNQKNGFLYTYSAAEQNELKRIREKYIVDTDCEESKIERLRRLDRGVTSKAQVISLTLGIIGILILGFGMSLAMSDLSVILGISQITAMIIGIITGLIGGAIASVAYPVYNLTVKREREKIAPEIIRLTDELMK